MGLTLEFRAGDKSLIADAVREIDFESLENPRISKFKVDLSLHITPHDLDLLSESFGEAAFITPLQLGNYLNGIVDEADRGALDVDREWVSYIASIDPKLIGRVSQLWAEKSKAAYPQEDVQLTNAMKSAVSRLLNFCKKAISQECDVVHVWFL